MNDFFLKPMLFVVLLGNQNFQIREASEECLFNYGPTICNVLESGLKNKDAEVVWRCSRLYDKSLITWLELEGPFPWLDSLPYDYPYRDSIIQTYLIDNNPLFDWMGYRDATYNWLRDKAREGVSRENILGILKTMRDRESYWKQNHSYPMIPLDNIP